MYQLVSMNIFVNQVVGTYIWMGQKKSRSRNHSSIYEQGTEKMLPTPDSSGQWILVRVH